MNYSNANTGSGGSAMSSFYDPNAYAPNPYEQDKQYKAAGGPTDFDDEPPLLEELGINPNHIFQKVRIWKNVIIIFLYINCMFFRP